MAQARLCSLLFFLFLNDLIAWNCSHAAVIILGCYLYFRVRLFFFPPLSLHCFPALSFPFFSVPTATGLHQFLWALLTPSLFSPLSVSSLAASSSRDSDMILSYSYKAILWCGSVGKSFRSGSCLFLVKAAGVCRAEQTRIYLILKMDTQYHLGITGGWGVLGWVNPLHFSARRMLILWQNEVWFWHW